MRHLGKRSLAVVVCIVATAVATFYAYRYLNVAMEGPSLSRPSVVHPSSACLSGVVNESSLVSVSSGYANQQQCEPAEAQDCRALTIPGLLRSEVEYVGHRVTVVGFLTLEGSFTLYEAEKFAPRAEKDIFGTWHPQQAQGASIWLSNGQSDGVSFSELKKCALQQVMITGEVERERFGLTIHAERVRRAPQGSFDSE